MRFIIIIIFFTASGITNAMTNEAKNALPELPQAKSLQANFTQKHYLPALNTPLVTHGHLSVDTQSLVWQVKSPYTYIYAMNNGTVKETGPNGITKILTIEQAPWLAPIKQLFSALLSANHQQLEQLFTIKTRTTKAGTLLSMTPRDEFLRQAITCIQIWHNPWPQHILIYEAGGGKLDITLKIITVEPIKDKNQ